MAALALGCALAAAALAAPGPSQAAGSGELGPPNLSAYCAGKGLGQLVLSTGAHPEYLCRAADGTSTPVDMQAACEFSYPQRPITAEQLTPGVLLTWECFQHTAGEGGPGGGGAGSPAGALHSFLLRALLPVGRGAKIGMIVSIGGYGFKLVGPAGGRLTLTWYYLPKGARISRAKPVLIATASVPVSSGVRRSVKIALNSRGRSMLRHARHLKLTGKGMFVQGGAATVTALRSFTLSR